jgi:hypothetical protein
MTKAQKTLAAWIDAQEMTGPRFDIERRDYVETDYLAFARRLIAEAVMDKLYYLERGRNDGRSGAMYRLERARDRARKAMREHTADEISNEELRQAFDEVASHEAELAFIQNEMAALQALYAAKLGTDGDHYVPYGQRGGRTPRGNVAPSPDNLPDDLARMAKALGVA